jgi:hypothetical protein
MLVLKSEYVGKVFHSINDLDDKTLDRIKKENTDFINKYFIEV